MMFGSLFGGIFLGWSLGRNNLSNLFGTAIGTRMIRFRTAAILAIVCIFAGALISGQATTASVVRLADLQTPADALAVSVAAGIVLWLSSRFGLPASIAQTSVGALVGWNLFHGIEPDMVVLQKMVGAWLVGPFLAAAVAWAGIRLTRLSVRRYAISIFKRDETVRIGLVVAGMLASYALGANNIGTITGPYLSVLPAPAVGIIILVCIAVGVGCWHADRRVIETVSRSLFPLSPTESLVVMMASAVTMFLFSAQMIRDVLIRLEAPLFPLVPLPMSSVMIGAIVGIALAKGGYGLKGRVLAQIMVSWVVVPVLAAAMGWLCLAVWGGV